MNRKSRLNGRVRAVGRVASVAVGVALASGIFVASSDANVVVNVWNNSGSFHHKRVGVPDQDQVRVGLPNEGKCYCVPTSTMNVLMYVANHGYPQVVPGPGNYSGYDNYYDVTALLETLGEEGSISPGGSDPDDPDCDGGLAGDGIPDGECSSLPCGGSSSNVYDAIIDMGWLGSAEDDLVWTARFLDDNAPATSFANLALLGVQGSVLTFGYGRYKPVGSSQGQTIYRRSGGHVVTMNEAYASGATRWLYVRDPGEDDGDVFGPSPYVTKKYTVTEETILVTTDPPGGVLSNWTQKTLSGLNEPHNDGVKRLVDGYLAVKPKTGVFWKNYVAINVAGLGLSIGGGGGGGGGGIWPIPTVGVEDLVLDQNQLGWYVLQVGTEVAPPALLHIDPAVATPTVLHATNATRLVLGRKCDIYTIVPSAGIVERYSCFGERIDTANVPGQPAAIAYDDATDRVLVLVPTTFGMGGSIVEFPSSLEVSGPGPVSHTIPFEVPTGGDVRLALEPGSTMLWISSKNGGKAFGLVPNPAAPGSLIVADSIGGFSNLTGIEFDDGGRLYAVDSGAVKAFERSSSGAWVSVDPGALGGLDVGSMIRIARSRTNYDPELHDTELFDQIDPDELLEFGESTLDCMGDLNGDGLVDGGDLGIMLNAWLGVGTADLNADGVVDGADLGMLLNAWGACP